jgi:hypothetical protein
MQGCRNYRKPRDGERYIYVSDDNKAEVEVIGHFRLLLKTGLYLDLFDTFVVPSFRRNLISISALDKLGFFVHLEMKSFVCIDTPIWLLLVFYPLWIIFML